MPWGAMVGFSLPLPLRVVVAHLPQALLDLQIGVIDRQGRSAIEGMHSLSGSIPVIVFAFGVPVAVGVVVSYLPHARLHLLVNVLNAHSSLSFPQSTVNDSREPISEQVTPARQRSHAIAVILDAATSAGLHFLIVVRLQVVITQRAP